MIIDFILESRPRYSLRGYDTFEVGDRRRDIRGCQVSPYERSISSFNLSLVAASAIYSVHDTAVNGFFRTITKTESGHEHPEIYI